jgi:hypothetical protein
MRRIFLASMLLLISGTAHAAGPAPGLIPAYDEKPAAPQPTAPEPAPAHAEATRIETDQKTGAIRFIVDGREVAIFERDGLHVRQDVNDGGLLTRAGGLCKNPR